MSASFLDQLRARAEPGLLWRDVKHLAIAVFLLVWGLSGDGDDSGDQFVGYLLIGGGLAWGAFIVRRYLARQTPASHPVTLALAALGDPATVSRAIDEDFAGRPLDGLPLQVGTRYLCFTRKAQITVVPLEHVMWVYPEVVRHSTNMIPTGRSHQLVVWKRDGAAENLSVDQAQVEACLQRLRNSAPWLPMGYNDVKKESWNADRREFIALVDAARTAAGG